MAVIIEAETEIARLIDVTGSKSVLANVLFSAAVKHLEPGSDDFAHLVVRLLGVLPKNQKLIWGMRQAIKDLQNALDAQSK